MKRKFLLVFVCLLCSCSAFANVEYKSDVPPILVQGAMIVETDFLISSLESPVSYKIREWDFTAGKIDGYPVVISKTESGVINATAATILGIENFKPVAVINQGTAGGHDPKLHTGDIVLSEKTFSGSSWRSGYKAEGEGVDYKNIEMLPKDFYYDDEKRERKNEDDIYLYSDKKLINIAESLKDSYTEGKVVKGVILTANSWESQIDRILFLHEKFGSSCEEMENYAAASICQDYGIPFLGIRILSNTALHNENFKPETGLTCQKFVLEFLREYIKTIK